MTENRNGVKRLFRVRDSVRKGSAIRAADAACGVRIWGTGQTSSSAGRIIVRACIAWIAVCGVDGTAEVAPGALDTLRMVPKRTRGAR